MIDIKEVRDYILENFLFSDNDGDLKNEESFLVSGILDSTGILEMITFLEERFGITVDEGEMVPENLDSVNNIQAYLEKKKVLNI